MKNKKKNRESKRRVPRWNWKSLPWKPLSALLTLGFFMIWWLRYDPAQWFRLRKLTIAGPTTHLNTEDIHKLTTATLGDPLMALDLDPIQAKIEAHPWVRSVQLRRLLPDTLYVHVQEHQPAAIVMLKQKYLVSTEGILFKQAEAQDLKKLPFITGLDALAKDKEDPQVQRRILESLVVIQQLKISGALEPFGLSEVHWKEGKFLSLLTQYHPFAIELGTAPWRQKLDRLIQVLPHVQKNGRFPTKISLENSEGVVVRYKEGGI